MSQNDLFSQLPRGSFDGITIPVVTVELLTGSSAAFHMYPYRAGQDIEYTGRDPITGIITAAFFPGVGNDSANVLWPGTLTTLRNRVQEQRSGELVIPPLGTLPKAMIRLHERYDPDHRDGAMVSIQFWEDSKDQFAKARLSSALGNLPASAAAVDSDLANLNLGADDDTGAPSFLQSIATLTNQLQSAQDDLGRPFRQMNALVQRIDDLFASVDALKDVSNWQAADDLRELKSNLLASIRESRGIRQIIEFVAARRMSIVQVAQSAQNTVADIMSLNSIPDPHNINAGTVLQVFKAA